VTDFGLPDELVEIERRLAAQFQVGPSSGLRERILLSIQRSVARETKQREKARGLWRFAACAAAAALVWANISLGVAKCQVNFTDSIWPHELGQRQIDHQVESLQRLWPGLSRDEARGQAVRLSIGLPRLPAGSVGPYRLTSSSLHDTSVGGLPAWDLR
jgi:hypothetical protein